mmetsp:Transcript_34706/g.53235  ORF Transcript_34706/g.53235 Transcript_34706/m.53235 type:complete len:156 (-) Transcript_34706:243-710(-)
MRNADTTQLHSLTPLKQNREDAPRTNWKQKRGAGYQSALRAATQLGSLESEKGQNIFKAHRPSFIPTKKQNLMQEAFEGLDLNQLNQFQNQDITQMQIKRPEEGEVFARTPDMTPRLKQFLKKGATFSTIKSRQLENTKGSTSPLPTEAYDTNWE